MQEHKFDQNVVDIFNTFTDEQKADYIAKETKMNKNMLIMGISLSVLFAILCICGVYCCMLETSGSSLVDALIAILFIWGISEVLPIWLIRSSLTMLKSTDEYKVKIRIERFEKQKRQKQREEQRKIRQN
ncbi:MAG: hypothetical protein OSJ83_07745 [Clostridia bacterium]|nr:hypothetical protein [Clostridia bacterium]